LIASPERGRDSVDLATLHAVLPASTLQRVGTIATLEVTDSTNSYLLRNAPPERGLLAACVADHQTAGRGRAGRQWRTEPGGGIAVSVAWRCVKASAAVGLPLASGVAVRRALKHAAALDVALKWPNDLVYDERKLGGILIETRPLTSLARLVVVGVGINVSLPRRRLETLSDWPRGAVDLEDALGPARPSRAVVIAAFLTEMAGLFAGLDGRGADEYLQEFAAADFLLGRDIEVVERETRWHGVGRGITADGRLQVETSAGVRTVAAGDVSVRWAS
jgi:BirA family biotin operon repressor/biotin-[acetyl-CoA-carboxylase] ligase